VGLAAEATVTAFGVLIKIELRSTTEAVREMDFKPKNSRYFILQA
jgi:hypothetical protein